MFTIAENLDLPRDAITQTFGVVARKGSGKTFTAGRLVERFLAGGCPVIVLDPVGNWLGLRLASNGVDRGFSIPVFGGKHGDAPLSGDEDEARALARALVEKNSSAVLDVSEMRKGDRKDFVTHFCEELFHAAKSHRSPRMVVLEESQVFAPQQSKGQERMLGAIEDIVRLGRNYGLGSMMISQRPQSVNKEVLNQVECLFVGQLSGFHERKAIQEWVSAKSEDSERAKEFIRNLPRLKVGDFFCWSPQWLDVLVQVRALPKTTLDYSATPTFGVPQKKLKLPPVDVTDLVTAMGGESGESKPGNRHAPGPPQHSTDASALMQQLSIELEEARADNTRLAERVSMLVGALARAQGYAATSANELLETIKSVSLPSDEPTPSTVELAIAGIERRAPSRPAPRSAEPKISNQRQSNLPKGEAVVLEALIQHPNGCTRSQLTVLTGYKRSTRDLYIQHLKQAGYIEQRGERLLATLKGAKAMPVVDKLPTGRELAKYWLTRLPTGEATVLERVLERKGWVARDTLTTDTGYKRSTRDLYIQKLAARELVETDKGAVRASEYLR